MENELSEDAARRLETLNAVLADLAAAGSDHGTVEAKRAGRGLPEGVTDTLSAFANTSGGLLLLGIDEDVDGTFTVTGVAEPKKVAAALQSAGEQMEPALRLPIVPVAHPDGVVLMADVPPVSRSQRPCHVASSGPFASSFIRVGDADQRLNQAEVASLLANRAHPDTASTPAPEGARLDPDAVSRFTSAVRESTEREQGTDDEILVRFGAKTVDEPHLVTLAGLLALGDNPQGLSGAARVNYVRQPRGTDPPRTRQSGTQLEGTLGELLDGVLVALSAILKRSRSSTGVTSTTSWTCPAKLFEKSSPMPSYTARSQMEQAPKASRCESTRRRS